MNHLPQRRPGERVLRDNYHHARPCGTEVVLTKGIALVFEHHDYCHQLSRKPVLRHLWTQGRRAVWRPENAATARELK